MENTTSTDPWWASIQPLDIFFFTVANVIAVVTLVGNVLAIIAFISNRRLRTVANYFIISLAVADMLVGLVSIPLYSVYLLLGWWPLGQVVCKLWLMLDYSLCYTSLLSIFIICIDRFWSVSNPVHYLNNMTSRLAFSLMVPVWLYPQLLFFFMVWLWPLLLPEYTSSVVEGTCDLPYAETVAANVSIAVISFWIPLIIIIILYYKIYVICRRLKQRASANKCSSVHLPDRGLTQEGQGSSRSTIPTRSSKQQLVFELHPFAENKEDRIERDEGEPGINGDCQHNGTSEHQFDSSGTGKKRSYMSNIGTDLLIQPGMIRAKLLKRLEWSRRAEQSHRASKTVKVVTVILLCYIVCWAPFSCVVMVRSADPDSIPGWLWTVCYCLCYINSTLNPFCYAYANDQLRKMALHHLRLARRKICCFWGSTHSTV